MKGFKEQVNDDPRSDFVVYIDKRTGREERRSRGDTSQGAWEGFLDKIEKDYGPDAIVDKSAVTPTPDNTGYEVFEKYRGKMYKAGKDGQREEVVPVDPSDPNSKYSFTPVEAGNGSLPEAGGTGLPKLGFTPDESRSFVEQQGARIGKGARNVVKGVEVFNAIPRAIVQEGLDMADNAAVAYTDSIKGKSDEPRVVEAPDSKVPAAEAPVAPPLEMPTAKLVGADNVKGPDIDAFLAAKKAEAAKLEEAQRVQAASVAVEAAGKAGLAGMLSLSDELALAAEKAGQEVVDRSLNAYKEKKAEYDRLDPTVDPQRYWKSKSGPQVVIGAVAGALFGWVGKGMDYLNMLQNEVKMDIDAQVQEYNNASDKAKSQVSAAGDEYRFFRQKGLDDAQARAAARSVKIDLVTKQIEAVKLAQSAPEIVARAEAMVQGLKAASLQQAGELASRTEQLKHSAQSRASMINADVIAKTKLEIDGIIASMRAQGPAQKPIAASTKEKLSALRSSLTQLDRAEEALGKGAVQVASDIFFQGLDSVASAFPGADGSSYRAGINAIFGDKSPFNRSERTEKAFTDAEKATRGEALSQVELEEAKKKAPKPGITSFNKGAIQAQREKIYEHIKQLESFGGSSTGEHTEDAASGFEPSK